MASPAGDRYLGFLIRGRLLHNPKGWNSGEKHVRLLKIIMGKQGKGKAKSPPPPPKKKTRLYQGMLAIAVVGVISLVFLLGGRESSTGSSASSAPTDFASSPFLRNRLVLPAWPQTPRPVTLPPEAFSEPEVRLAYQAAKEIPDVLEHIACYCGCYGSAGHRNNLDCYKDNHGVT